MSTHLKPCQSIARWYSSEARGKLPGRAVGKEFYSGTGLIFKTLHECRNILIIGMAVAIVCYAAACLNPMSKALLE